MLSYNNYLYQVVLQHVMTLYIIILCNCSPDCMYIIMYFWPYRLWPSGLIKLSCLVLPTNDFHHIGHEKFIFCFSVTCMKNRMREGEKKILYLFFSCVPVDSIVRHCVILYTLPLMIKIFSRTPRWNAVLMFYNITRAVTIAFNALRNAVVWSNLRKLHYIYIVSTI